MTDKDRSDDRCSISRVVATITPIAIRGVCEGKEVKQYMKRIIKVLVVCALMVVLMATTVSPAFARNCSKNYGYGCDESLQEQGDGQGSGTGYGNQREGGNVGTCDNGGLGWGCR